MTMTDQMRQQYLCLQSGLPLDVGEGAYCIGGAVYAAAFPEQPFWPFPDVGALGKALRQRNPALTHRAPLCAAADVQAANDRDDCEMAWRLVHVALSTTRGDGL